MKPLRVAVVGFGRVGQACGELLCGKRELRLAAVIRRAATAAGRLPDALRQIPVFTHIGQAGGVDAALICVPTQAAADVACQSLQHGIPIVDCATLHGEAFCAHKQVIHAAALRHRVPAVVGAGWDPGVLSVFRSWFALLTPGGATETRHHAGISLRHTTMARSVGGVKDALCAEVRATDGTVRRYVYVELEPGAQTEAVAQAIRADPLFLEEDTQVFPVESLAELEQEGHGVVLERRGPSGRLAHHRFLLEARLDEAALTAEVMLAAARALPDLKPGAYLLSDVPLGALWGEGAEKAERDWT